MFILNVSRFENGFKKKKPFNALCLLDPRNIDIYFGQNEKEAAIEVIKEDVVFDDVREEEEGEVVVEERVNSPAASTSAQPNDRYCTVQCTLYCTIQYSTVLYHTVQHCTVSCTWTLPLTHIS